MTEPAHQLTLFPEDVTTEIDNQIEGVSWSYSKRDTFERCPRQYYYEYFGSRKQTALNEPAKEQIQFFGKLSPRYLRAGEILHFVIRVTLQKAQTGEFWDANRIASWGVSLLRKDREYSRVDPDGKNTPQTQYPPHLLMEYFFHFTDVEADYDEIEARLFNALNTFATSEALEEFRQGARQADSLIEKHFALKSLSCKVEGKIDLAFQTQNFATIVDWKLGQEDGIGEDSLQLGIYALWGIEQFQCLPEQIRIFKAFLGSNTVVQFDVDSDKLWAIKARIVQDAERLASVQDYGDSGNVAAFTPCYKQLICKNCRYQRLCYGS